MQHPKTKSDFERIHKDLIGRPVDKNGSVPGIGVIIKELSA